VRGPGAHRVVPFAAVVACLLAAPAAAQYDPAFVWRTIDTEHFQIHYHQGEEALAQRVAGVAEHANAVLSPIMGYAPAERTQIVLADDTDDANGSATPLPYNTIRLNAVPPESGSQLADARDWLEQLVVHEYTHILHLDNVGGIPAFLNAVLGKIFAPNGLVPPWMIEGIAVAHESLGDPATGRNASALFDMYARALVVEPPGLPSLDQASNFYLRWPQGDIPYLLGGRFIAFLLARSGEGALRGFMAEQGSQLWPYAPSFAAERWFGADLPTLWEEFRTSLKARYAAQLERVRRRPVTVALRLTHRGAFLASPRFTPDGGSLLYLDRGPDERAGLREVTLTGLDRGRKLGVEGNGVFDVDDRGRVAVALTQVFKEYRLYDDLWLGDLSRGTTERLTDGERATDPAFTHDGTGLLYVAHVGGGEQALRRRPVAGGQPETLLTRPGLQLYEPRPSPDGRRIALSIQEGGRRDIALWQDGALVRLTDDDALDLSPSWTPDGRYLLFASDRGGIFNIYAWEADTGDLRQVTNLESGALEPEVSPDGRTIAFVGYTREGHDLFTLPFDPSAWLEPEAAEPAPPQPTPSAPAPLPTRPYSAFETLRPTFLLPIIGSDVAGTTYGLFSFGSDVVGRHAWQAEGFVSPKARTAGYAVSYLGGWSWPRLDLFSERYVDGSPGGPSRLVAVWTPLSGGLNFTFTRLERAFALRLGWAATRYDTLGILPDATGIPAAYLFRDGLLSEATFGAAYSDARRFTYSISPEEGRTLTAQYRLASNLTGSDYELWRGRAAWAEYLRVPGTQHAVLATRLSGALGRGSLGGYPPFSLGGISQPNVIDLFLLQTFSPSDQLRGYPAGLLLGNGTALLNLELRLPIADPQWGHSTWPLFVRRIHGALFVDAGEAFVTGHERGYSGPDFHFRRLRVGAGAELRLELVIGYWLVTDLRLGAARGLGKPFGGVSPAQDPYAETEFYVTYGPSF
jgi:dipeptidyl aminopeptidase/acylaminoacyl peptidase